MGVCMGRTQGMQTQKGLVQHLLQKQGGFHGVLGFTPLILGTFCMSWKRVWLLCWFYIFWRCAVPLCFSSANFAAPKSHVLMVEIEAQREVGAGGLQMHLGQVVDGGLHLSGIILMNLEAHG